MELIKRLLRPYMFGECGRCQDFTAAERRWLMAFVRVDCLDRMQRLASEQLERSA